MNKKIKRAKIEVDNKNYEKALSYLNEVDKDEEHYYLSLIMKSDVLIKLEKFSEALELINELIGNNPYDELLWMDKVVCHFKLNQEDEALNALNEVERLADESNKKLMLAIARFYNMLSKDEKTLEYCDKALKLDENYKEAVFEKSLIAVRIDDSDMINDCAEKLLKLGCESSLDVAPIFLLKLFSNDYEFCLNLVNENLDKDKSGDLISMFKTIIYKHLSEYLGVNILINKENGLDLDDVIGLLLDYKKTGCSAGEVNDVEFIIIDSDDSTQMYNIVSK